MDSTWSVLAALTFGILLGAGFTVVLHMAERRGQSAARVVAPTIPDARRGGKSRVEGKPPDPSRTQCNPGPRGGRDGEFSSTVLPAGS